MATNREPTYRILHGDARKLLSEIGPVDCVVTSPPYFNQRVYGDTPDLEVGLEKHAPAYIDELVNIFLSVPLRAKGSIWVNIGDKRSEDGLLCIPQRFCIAMVDAGFRLVDDVIWAKSQVEEDGTTVGNCMPEPCRNRLNGNGHEPMFRFTKAKDAWTDTLAVQIPRSEVDSVPYLPADLMSVKTSINGRNLHNVWRAPMGQTKHRHYAVFPPALVERPIAMTCPLLVEPDGSLPRRQVDWIKYDERRHNRNMRKNHSDTTVERTGRNDAGRDYVARMPISLGWESVSDAALPGVVFDPFCGTGTTGEVALKLGRSFVGIDLYEEYVEMSRGRCEKAFDYVRMTYGYQHLYDMIMLDQSGMIADCALKDVSYSLIK